MRPLRRLGGNKKDGEYHVVGLLQSEEDGKSHRVDTLHIYTLDSLESSWDFLASIGNSSHHILFTFFF